MFGIPWRFAAYIGGALTLVAIVIAVKVHFGNDRDIRDQLAAYKDGADKVVLALEHATGEEAFWDTAPGQIIALGESNRDLKASIVATNARIDEMAREAVRLKAKAAELKAIADKAQAQRQSALRKLSDMTITPGTRSDCFQLLREAEEALDLVREAGA